MPWAWPGIHRKKQTLSKRMDRRAKPDRDG
jgi:hypothetical protein